MEADPRRVQVDVSKLDLDAALTEALRLLAAPDGGASTFVVEAARIVGEFFDDLDIDAVDDESLSVLAHRVIEIVAGLSIAGYGATSIAAEAREVDRLDVLRAIETSVRDED